MEYVFKREWSRIDTIIIVAESEEQAEELLEGKQYSDRQIQEGSSYTQGWVSEDEF